MTITRISPQLATTFITSPPRTSIVMWIMFGIWNLVRVRNQAAPSHGAQHVEVRCRIDGDVVDLVERVVDVLAGVLQGERHAVQPRCGAAWHVLPVPIAPHDAVLEAVGPGDQGGEG